MGTVNLKTASGGAVILSPANTAVDTTITVPAVTATMAVNGPAFSAYQSTLQALVTSTSTKILFQTTDFDTTGGMYSTSTSRFTPTVAGYYQVNAAVFFNLGVSTLSGFLQIVKNASAYKSVFGFGSNVNGYFNPTVSALVYLNGSTDYLEIYAQQQSGSNQNTSASATSTYFQAAMVRSA